MRDLMFTFYSNQAKLQTSTCNSCTMMKPYFSVAKKPKGSSKWQPVTSHYFNACYLIIILLYTAHCQVKSSEICYYIKGIPFLRLASMHPSCIVKFRS